MKSQSKKTTLASLRDRNPRLNLAMTSDLETLKWYKLTDFMRLTSDAKLSISVSITFDVPENLELSWSRISVRDVSRA